MTKPWIAIFHVTLLPLSLAVVTLSAANAEDFALAPGQSCMSASCHTDLGKKKYVHLVAADGTTCMVCHQSIEQGVHGFKLTADGGALCAQCHGDKVDKKHKHVPVELGLCTFCHNPHQSDNPRQLNYPLESLCTVCHTQQPFTGDKVTHGPVAEGQCIKCHNPHSSDHPKQLEAAVPDLCFGCHDKSQKDAKGRRLPPVKATFENEELNRHMPFALGACLSCHNPHASPNYRLLEDGGYPESFYATYSKDKYICFSCHSEKAFAEPRTLTDTAFRNGNLNLHYRHVNRKKGRTCRACHHHHGAESPKLIRKTIPFGNRFINIKVFEKTETGGKCGPTCHPTVRYDRYEPVQNLLKVTPRQGADATQEELEQARKTQQ